MTDQANPPATGDPGSRGELPWDDFEARLVAALERMALDQYLILSTRPAGDDESLYFVQFAQGGRAGFRAEAVSNRYQDPDEGADGLREGRPLARRVVADRVQRRIGQRHHDVAGQHPREPGPPHRPVRSPT